MGLMTFYNVARIEHITTSKSPAVVTSMSNLNWTRLQRYLLLPTLSPCSLGRPTNLPVLAKQMDLPKQEYRSLRAVKQAQGESVAAVLAMQVTALQVEKVAQHFPLIAWGPLIAWAIKRSLEMHMFAAGMGGKGTSSEWFAKEGAMPSLPFLDD